MNNRHLFLRIFLVSILATRIALAQDTGVSRGSQLLSPFKQDLQAALQEGLRQGVVEAIEVCQVQAPGIANSLSTDGVRIGRSSHRLRNPGNTPPSWVEPIMEDYMASASDRDPKAVPLANNRVGYVEPIVVQPLCLACHGEALDSDVASKINELYPEDKAVGFNAGDLRGVFWIEYPEN